MEREISKTSRRLVRQGGRLEPEEWFGFMGPNQTEFVAWTWRVRRDVGTLFIKPGSPWENGYIESFNAKLRNEPLNREIF